MILQGLTYSCQSFQIGFLRLCIQTTEWPCKQHFVLCLSTFRHTGTFYPQNSFPWSKNFLDLLALKYSATVFIFNESWLWAKFWKDAKLHIPRVKSALLWLKARVVICHIGNNRICNSIHHVSIVPKWWMRCSLQLVFVFIK